MLEKTQARTLPVLNRAVDLAPAVNACCGACRTCVTTNVLTLAGAGVAGLAVYSRRIAARILHRS
jgi:hypothetical protein